jgi:predicted adenylyl cyclase CyaB
VFFNVEIKARYSDLGRARAMLGKLGARFAGADEQRDTYFAVSRGRLKLRDGPSEKALIFYERPDAAAVKESTVALARLEQAGDLEPLRAALREALGVRIEVRKRREIWFLENVKIHLDEVAGLGAFLEIEAQGERDADRPRCQRQVDELMAAFGVRPEDLQSRSYADMLAGAPPS